MTKQYRKKSPLQIVKDEHKSKADLAKRLGDLLEPEEDETKEELTARLTRASNSKLLHLLDLAKRAEAQGGREGLVSKIAAANNKSGDKDYIAALSTKRSLGWLVDRAESLAKKSKQAG